jgi:hypothetical protein
MRAFAGTKARNEKVQMQFIHARANKVIHRHAQIAELAAVRRGENGKSDKNGVDSRK